MAVIIFLVQYLVFIVETGWDEFEISVYIGVWFGVLISV